MDEGGRRVEEKRRRRRRRPAEMQTALLGHSPLHVTANIFTSYTSISPTLFYNIHLHLSSHAQLLVSLSLFSAPELCLFSPPSTSYLLTSPPPGSTPSLRSSRRQKKKTPCSHASSTLPLSGSTIEKKGHLAISHYSPLALSGHSSPSRHGFFHFLRAWSFPASSTCECSREVTG